MAIERDPGNLRLEIEYAEQVRDKHLANLDAIVRGFTTPFWKSESGAEFKGDSGYQPENHNYKILRWITPKLAFQRPRVSMSSRMVGLDDELREREVVLDQWMQDHQVERLGQELVPDFMATTCVSHVSVAPHPYLALDGMLQSPDQEPAVDVMWERLSPKDFFFDPSARTRGAREYEGHGWVTDKPTLIARAEFEEGWDLEAIQSLPEESSAIEEGSTPEKANQPDRKELAVYQIWFRGERIKDENTPARGYHGAIYTLAVARSDDKATAVKFIREPMDFFGPASGPYCGGEVYYVPDSSFGLAPFIAHEGQNRDLNRHAQGVSEMAARYKRLILCASNEIAEEIESKPNDYIITIPGLEATAVIELEIGGVTDQVLGYLQLAQGRLESVSGLSEALQGAVSGRGTATEQQIASTASDVATDFVKSRFQSIFAEGLSKVDWYINMHPKFRAAVSPEILSEDLKGEFQDGEILVFEGGSPSVPPELLALEIEPMSMERVSEALLQRRVLDLSVALGNLLPLQAQFPNEGWSKIYEMLGQAMNIPGLGDMFGQAEGGQPEQASAATLQSISSRIRPQGVSLPGVEAGANIQADRATA